MGAGFFLVLEGPEGAGKSTLARALEQRMTVAKIPSVFVREPGGTPAAEALRNELLGDGTHWTPEMELLYIVTARADLVRKVIRPALEAGQVVVSDRYELSTRAYQLGGRGLPAGHVDWVNEAATGGLRPDLTVVLDIDPEEGRRRQLISGKRQDRLDRESESFHRRVAEVYRNATGPTITHLDANQSAEQLAQATWDLIRASRPDLFEVML